MTWTETTIIAAAMGIAISAARGETGSNTGSSYVLESSSDANVAFQLWNHAPGTVIVARADTCAPPNVARVVEVPFTPSVTIDSMVHTRNLVLSCPTEGACHWVAEPEPPPTLPTEVRCLTPDQEAAAIERGRGP